MSDRETIQTCKCGNRYVIRKCSSGHLYKVVVEEKKCPTCEQDAVLPVDKYWSQCPTCFPHLAEFWEDVEEGMYVREHPNKIDVVVVHTDTEANKDVSAIMPKPKKVPPRLAGELKEGTTVISISGAKKLSEIEHTMPSKKKTPGTSDTNCPDCGGQLEITEGCKKCRMCGWSKCG